MNSRIDEQTAHTELSQIMDLAANNAQRFVVDRLGGPAVVIMSIQEYIRLIAPAPAWMERAWKGAEERGISTMTMEEIDEEIAAYRREEAARLEHEAA